MDYVVSTRVEHPTPVIPGSIRVPCFHDPSHEVWISPASQAELADKEPLCIECLGAMLEVKP